MSHNVTPNTSRVELRKTLTLVPVVMMGLAYMQPMTLFDTFGIVSGLTDGLHILTPRNTLARLSALWWVGLLCSTICSRR